MASIPPLILKSTNQQQKAAAVAWERWVAQQRLSLGELLEQVPSCKPSLEGE